jgi:hypothetical protein
MGRSDVGEHPVEDGHERCEVAGGGATEQVHGTLVTLGAR